VKGRLSRAARWLAPSIAAACAGALAAGSYDAIGAAETATGFLATAGYVAILATPVFLVLALVLRGLWAAWSPRALIETTIEPDTNGSAPRLAGWVAVVWLALLGFSWVGFQATWLLNAWTAFKPVVVAFGMAVFFVVTGVAVLVGSRPVARGIATIVRALDRRWRRDRPARSSLATPAKIFAGAAITTIAIAVLVFLFARMRLGPIDYGLAIGPVLGLGVLLVAHLVRGRLPRVARWTSGALAVAALVATLVIATLTTKHDPSLVLEIWGDRPLAGLAIDRVFDIDQVRADISLAQFRPGVQPEAAHPDIVLVTIDTVRADRTPPYQRKAEMPGLRALGERGVVFEYAFAPGNVTRRSIPAMAIGLHPNRVRGRVVGWALRVDPRHVMLAERMRAGGYDTAGFMCCEGFYGPEARTGLQRGLEHVEIDKNGLLLARKAHTWIAERDKRPDRRPLFMWVHLLEPHLWAQIHGEPKTDEERKRSYDKTLGQADQILVELLGAFSHRKPEQAPIVIVTADHGEGLGDHGEPYHGTDLYNSQLRVPLVMAGPGIMPGRVTETVALVDLVPTIMDLAGFVPPTGPSIDGRSLEQLITGKRVQDFGGGVAFAAMIADRSNPGGLNAIVKGKYKLVSDGVFYELFDIRADPDEQFNIHLRHPAVLNELKRLMSAHLRHGSVSPFE